MPADLSRPSSLAKPRRASKKDPDEDKFDSAHVREIELKRSRGEISCAECRRLKIRCDKSIPCKSCQRRGCAALCPNGSLATGQGTRFVLAATEYLHKRIAKMNERIRQLEDALAILQARCSNDPHPLLREDVVAMKVEQEDEESDLAVEPANPADIIDTFGTLSVSDHGVSRFFGPTGGTEYLLFTENDTPPCSPPLEGVSPDSGRDSMTPPISGELTRFSASFPFTPIGSPSDVQQLIEQYLPPWERATHLCETYLENAGWLFRGVTRQQLVLEMLPVIYKRPIPAGTSVASLDYTGPHDLALIFLVFALGALLDLSQEPYSAEGEHYHHLARAALCLQPVLEKPSIVAIQALRLLSVYTAMAGKELRGSETTMETTWSLLALSAQLAHSIGLHRDSARWGLSKCMVNRRRLLFWDLFIGDAWQSLTTGRPPSFTRDYIDCKYPALQHVDVEEELDDSDEDSEEHQNDFNTWGCRFAVECVSEVAARALAAEPPSYQTIMELDRRVREFPVPREVVAILEDLKNPSEEEDAPPLTTSMERMVLSHCREVVLLWIHRSYFAQAIIDCPSNPLRSQFANSFLATYRASVTVLGTIKNQFSLYPSLCARFWLIWTYAFSAAAVFGFVVTRGPRSPLAASAMAQLDTARELFAKAAVHSRRAAKALPLLTKWSEKAHAALRAAGSGASHDGELWSVNLEDDSDELEIFAGKTRLVESKRPSPSPNAESKPEPQTQSVQPPLFNPRIPPAIHPPPVLPSLPQMPTSAPPRSASTWTQQQEPIVNPQRYSSMSYQQQQPADMYLPTSYSHSPAFSQSPGADHIGYNWPPTQPGPAPQVHGEAYLPVSSQAHPVHQQYANFVQQPYAQGYPEGYVRGHERMVVMQQHQAPPNGVPEATYVPPPELVNLGLASRDSRLGERWTSFMHESGFLDGFDYDRTS